MFTRANLSRALLSNVNLEGAVFWSAVLKGAYHVRANLRRASLNRANLEGAYLGRSDLRGALLFETRLHRGFLMEANLKGAQLRGANLARVDLSTTLGLTQQQLNSAIGDKDTKIPEGLTRPAPWS